MSKKKTAHELLIENTKSDSNYGYILIEHWRNQNVRQNADGLSPIEIIGLLGQMSVFVSSKVEDSK